jgi:hypothetical protein
MFPAAIEQPFPSRADARSRGTRRRRWAERAWDTLGFAVAALTLEDDFDDLDWDLGDGDGSVRPLRRVADDTRACEARPARPSQPHCPNGPRPMCSAQPSGDR